jgi:FkbM family methyltransferase
MEHLRNDWSEFLEYAKNFITEPLSVLDIGCSGGIDEILKNFGDKILYHGFDPNVEEISRLKQNNQNPNINYIEAFIDCGSKEEEAFKLNNCFTKLSAFEGCKIIKQKETNHQNLVQNNLWTEMKLSPKKIKIPEFLEEKNLQSVDFIKSDIDSYDLSFLKSCQEILQPKKIMAIMAEVSFACNENDEASLTTFLRQFGFGLNLLTTRSYSSKFLPDFYSLNIAAQTIGGRIVQGDALYFKDDSFFKDYTPQQLLKLAILFDLFNLPDQAAAVLIQHRDKIFKTKIDVKKALDLLTEERKFLGKLSYEEFIAKFYAEHEKFFPNSYSAINLVKIFEERISKIGDGSLYRALKPIIDSPEPQQQDAKKFRT